MNFKPRIKTPAPLRLVVVGGLQDGAEHPECPNVFSIGSTPDSDYLLIDANPATTYRFERKDDCFSITVNGQQSETLLGIGELFSVGACEVKLCIAGWDVDSQLEPLDGQLGSDLRSRLTGLMKTRSGVVSVVGASLMGVALTAALASGVLGESDDQALQSALTSHGAKNVYVSRNNGDLIVKAQFDNQATKTSFAGWMAKRMGSEAKLVAEVSSQQVVSTMPVVEVPKVAFASPMESAFGCSRDCFDPSSISMIRVGSVPRIYLNNGSFLSVGDRIAKGVYVDDVADGSITISNGEKTVTLVVE